MIKKLLIYLLIFHHIPSVVLAAGENINNSPNALIPATSDISNVVDLKELNIPQCIHNHPIIEECEFTICRASTYYGNIYIKVKNSPNNTCQYVERIPGLGGMNCTFEEKELKSLHQLFVKNFERFAGMNIIMTVTDFQNLSNIFNKKCVFYEDYSLTKKVTLNSSKSDFFDPEFKSDEISKYITNYYINHKDEKEDKKSKLTLNKYHSIFLNNEQINSINQLLPKPSIQSQNKVSNENSEITQFSINSINYISPQNWTVKLNGIEYTNKSSINYIIFENVTPQLIQIKWFISNLDKISPQWSRNFIALGEGQFKSIDNNILIQTGSVNYTITFSLKPHEIFDITTMKIVNKLKN